MCGNHAPAERLLPVNFGLGRMLKSPNPRQGKHPTHERPPNPRVRRHALGREQNTVHLHELELTYRLAALNLHVDLALTPGILDRGS
jgi:hypothetical protein